MRTLLKKLQILLFKNIKIIISIIININLASIIYYLEDIIDLNLFKKKNKINFNTTDLLDLNENLDVNIDEGLTINEDENLNKNKDPKKYNYLLIGTGLIVLSIFMYYYFNDGAANAENLQLIKEGFDDMLSKLNERYHEHYYDPDTGRTGTLFKKVVNRGMVNEHNIYPASSLSSTDKYIPEDNRRMWKINWFNEGFDECHD